MKVVIVGAGNVATVLGRKIKKANHDIVQVLSRNEEHARELANILGCEPGNLITTLYKDADLYLFAIADNALYHLDQFAYLEKKLVVHTAGSVSKDVLNIISKRYGVVYPLQSLNRDSDELPEMPLLIDGSTPEILVQLKTFAQTITDDVTIVSDEERLKFHIAAIFVNNFTNHLYTLADNFCNKEHIDFKKLLPLIYETTNRLKKHPPADVQTGPAIREDTATLTKHLNTLSADPGLRYIYLKMSESILKFHKGSDVKI